MGISFGNGGGYISYSYAPVGFGKKENNEQVYAFVFILYAVCGFERYDCSGNILFNLVADIGGGWICSGNCFGIQREELASGCRGCLCGGACGGVCYVAVERAAFEKKVYAYE